VGKLGPELDLFLHAVIFRMSLWQINTTYGNQLQNLMYDHLTPRQKLLYFFLTAGNELSSPFNQSFNQKSKLIESKKGEHQFFLHQLIFRREISL
jgi:hypothetical protein